MKHPQYIDATKEKPVVLVPKRKHITVFMDSSNGEVGVDTWLIAVVTPRRRLELELLNNPNWRPF